MTEPATGELPWLTLSEAAEKTGVNRNTVHFAILMAAAKSIRTVGCGARGRSL